jgi:hypothetical protein
VQNGKQERRELLFSMSQSKKKVEYFTNFLTHIVLMEGNTGHHDILIQKNY